MIGQIALVVVQKKESDSIAYVADIPKLPSTILVDTDKSKAIRLGFIGRMKARIVIRNINAELQERQELTMRVFFQEGSINT